MVTPLVKRLHGVDDERRVDVTMTNADRALLEQSACLGYLMVERSAMTNDQLEALNKQIQTLRAQTVKG